MNRLVIIGNGFDMAHGLKTSYMDFMNWYWDQRVNSFIGNTTKESEDSLCKLIIKDNEEISCWNVFAFNNSYFFKDILRKERYTGYEIIQYIKNTPEVFSIECCHFLRTILQSMETKGWVDIENDYYQLLKDCIDNPHCTYTANELNQQLLYLQTKLVEYLSTQKITELKSALLCAIKGNFNPVDFSTEWKKKALGNMGFMSCNITDILHDPQKQQKLHPRHFMLLSFNYTNTAKEYTDSNVSYNYIHGELEHPENIIFGYGDELDKKFQDLLDKNDNELLRYVKSVKYLETRHYRELLDFLMSDPFQVLIMGHSCGNSDRTLLNTIFEHKNCVCIKPFYHKRDNGQDNYLELVQNIYRNFTDMKLFRDRVVNKEQCQTM